MANCLIVEDSEVIRFVVKRIFEELGHAFFEAETAEDGLQVCRDNEIEYVFLDWDMPQMGALDFLQGLFSVPDQKTHVILCATENDPQQFALAKAAGAKFHLLKPFDVNSVRAALMQVGSHDDEVVETKPSIVEAEPQRRRK